KADRIEHVFGVGIDTRKFGEPGLRNGNKRSELGVSNNDFVLLSVGELNKNKNHEIIIRAIAKLNNRNIQYILCGQGELSEYLFELVKELGLESQVKFLGYREDISSI